MTLSFIEWRERPKREQDSRKNPDAGFYVTIATCLECVRGAVKINVALPAAK